MQLHFGLFLLHGISTIKKYKHINGNGYYYTYAKLYNRCVCPVIAYCAEVCGFKDFTQIDYLLNKAIRILLGVYRFAPLNAINWDMEWYAFTN